MFKIIYETIGDIPEAHKANAKDSGYDIFLGADVKLKAGERATVPLGVKFKIVTPWYMKFMKLFGLGIEGQIRPKSGRSKNGIDVEIGTIDQDYRGEVGATVTNTTKKPIVLKKFEKVCQIVFVPVFNRVKLEQGKVDAKTERGAGGFGSSGLAVKEKVKAKK